MSYRTFSLCYYYCQIIFKGEAGSDEALLLKIAVVFAHISGVYMRVFHSNLNVLFSFVLSQSFAWKFVSFRGGFLLICVWLHRS